jgi:hypothetical protein
MYKKPNGMKILLILILTLSCKDKNEKMVRKTITEEQTQQKQ